MPTYTNPSQVTAALATAIQNNTPGSTALYNSLYQIHSDARTNNIAINYPSSVSGNPNKVILLNITSDLPSIPLSSVNNFNGWTFNVANTQKDYFLFVLSPQSGPTSISVNKSLLKKNSTISTLGSGIKLLSVTDNNTWTTRTGYGNVLRKDILVVSDGIVQNDPISGYDNNNSSPSCVYYGSDNNLKWVTNAYFIRDSTSTFKTFFLKAEGQYNLWIYNIHITTLSPTPSTIHQGMFLTNLSSGSTLTDQVITIRNSANVELDSIYITDTYSSNSVSGYGINMDNIFDINIYNIQADAVWGVFGNSNINTVELLQCQINRFDIHSYGKDVTCKHCTFRNLKSQYFTTTHVYNRYSSIFGTVRYYFCDFEDFLPVRIDPAYNAYTSYDLILEFCTLDSYPCIVHIPSISNTTNSRPELQSKCLPNVYITGLSLHIANNVTSFHLFKIDSLAYTGLFYQMYYLNVDISPLTQSGMQTVTLYDANVSIQLGNTLNASFTNDAAGMVQNISGE